MYFSTALLQLVANNTYHIDFLRDLKLRKTLISTICTTPFGKQFLNDKDSKRFQ